MRKRKLLIASDSFLPRWDGVARFLSEILPSLTDIFSVTVIVPKFKGSQPRIKGVHLVTIPTYNFEVSDYQLPRFDREKVADNLKGVDLVWTHTIGPIGCTAIYLAKRLGIKVVSYVHSLEWELIPKSLPRSRILRISSTAVTRHLAKRLYNKVDLLLVPSEEVAQLLDENQIRTKSRIVPMGVNVSKFIPPKDKRTVKQSLRISPDTFIIGFCGRIAREKDLPTLYRAFVKVSEKYPNTILMLIGAGLRRLQSEFSHPNVLFVGSTNMVLPYLQSMDMYVLPSLTETSSLSTMEAMACAVPVLVTPVGLIKHYVEDDYNGYFFPKGNSDILASDIEKLILDEKLRIKLGRNARKTVIKGHRWKKTVRAIRKVLSNL